MVRSSPTSEVDGEVATGGSDGCKLYEASHWDGRNAGLGPACAGLLDLTKASGDEERRKEQAMALLQARENASKVRGKAYFPYIQPVRETEYR